MSTVWSLTRSWLEETRWLMLRIEMEPWTIAIIYIDSYNTTKILVHREYFPHKFFLLEIQYMNIITYPYNFKFVLWHKFLLTKQTINGKHKLFQSKILRTCFNVFFLFKKNKKRINQKCKAKGNYILKSLLLNLSQAGPM